MVSGIVARNVTSLGVPIAACTGIRKMSMIMKGSHAIHVSTKQQQKKDYGSTTLLSTQKKEAKNIWTI